MAIPEATTPLVATMQALAKEDWKENAFPVIHNGRIVEWNRYYFDDGKLLWTLFSAKCQGLSPETYDVVSKKIDYYKSKKITGKEILYKANAYGDRTLPQVDVICDDLPYRIQKVFIDALRQDSPVLDDLFANETYECGMTQTDFNLLINFAYPNTKKEQLKYTTGTLIRIGQLAQKYQMHDVLAHVKAKLYWRVVEMDDESINSLEFACNCYTLYDRPEDWEFRKHFEEYFSRVVSRLAPSHFERVMVKLSLLEIHSFKLWPQKDGNDDRRAELLIERCPFLLSLDLSCVSDLHPNMLVGIQDMNQLEWLFLNGCTRINDKAMEWICKVNTLTNLVLSGENITKEGIKHVENLTHLEQLIVWDGECKGAKVPKK